MSQVHKMDVKGKKVKLSIWVRTSGEGGGLHPWR